MTETATPNGRLPDEADFAAAIDWWREAGVDCDFSDDVTDWLTPAPEAAAPAPAGIQATSHAASPPSARSAPPLPVENTSPVRFGGDEASWPGDLAAFGAWWLAEPSLETGGTGPRIAPHGPAQPDLMVIVDHPEEADRDRLLSASEGRLLAGFLRAAGVAAENVYLASLLPRFTAAPDWSALGANGCDAVLAHHIGLVQPKRILVLGRNIPPLLGHDTAQEGKSLRCFNHKGRSFPCVEGQGLARLLRSAAARRDLWQSWLDGTDG